MTPDKETQDIVDKYVKKWRVNTSTKVHLSDNNKINKREIGEIWKENEKWCIQKKGYIEKRSTHPSIDIGDNKLFMRCIQCEKKVLNNKKRSTEIDVMMTTGMCLKCNADKELNEIVEHGKPLEKDWMQKAVFKDSYGNTLISEDEIRQEFGEEEYQKVKQKHEELLRKRKSNEKSTESGSL